MTRICSRNKTPGERASLCCVNYNDTGIKQESDRSASNSPHILSTEPRKGTQVGEVQNNDKFIGERGERRSTPWTPENKDGNQIRQRPRERSEENQFLEAQWPRAAVAPSLLWTR